MEKIAPAGPVYQAGTLSGNPVAVTAGLAVLEAARRPARLRPAGARGAAPAAGLEPAARRERGSRPREPRRFDVHAVLHRRPGDGLTARGRVRHRPLRPLLPGDARPRLCLAPSQFEAAFVSTAHTEADLAAAADAAGEALKAVARG